jgi:replicative DNA helicase
LSVGLQLIRALIETHARTEFRQVGPDLMVSDELPAWEFVSSYYRRHGQLPTVGTLGENGLRLPVAPEPPAYYIERCRSRAIYNTIVSEQPELARAMMERNMAGAVEVLQRMNTSAGRFQAVQDVHTMGEMIDEVLEQYQVAHRNPGRQGVTLGWGYLDEVTGGAEGGDVVTFVARPGMGKSYLLTSIARQAWLEGNNVLFVTMEMTGPQIARRMLGLHSGINPDYIRRGQLSTYTEGVMHQAAEGLRGGPPFHMLSGSFDKSVPIVDAAIQEFAPDLVVIDASYLMQPASGKNGRRSQWEIISDVGSEIKQMAMARNRPVIQSVQFNREAGRTKEVDLIHIGGSDAVGQISTIAIAIQKGDAPHETTRRKLKVMKNREGDGGAEMQINFLFDPPDFSFIADETDDAQDPTADEWEV